MKPYQDYMYHFPQDSMRISGRCRVRLYKLKNGVQTVLLTEVKHNSGESITTACDRIATDLTARWKINPRTTRWIQHNSPETDESTEFVRLKFTWNSEKTAEHPQWERLTVEQAELLTGEPLSALNRRLGDSDH